MINTASEELYKAASCGYGLKGQHWLDLLYDHEGELCVYVDPRGCVRDYYIAVFDNKPYLYRSSMRKPRCPNEIGPELEEIDISWILNMSEVWDHHITETPFGDYIEKEGLLWYKPD